VEPIITYVVVEKSLTKLPTLHLQFSETQTLTQP